MKTLMVGILGLALLLASGCGVKKDYVNQSIADSEAKMNDKVSALQNDVTANQDQLQKLQALSQELSKKTDMALNKAAGFENYQQIWDGVINFDFDSYDITSAAEGILMDACEKLEQNPGAVIEIGGHTDKTGSSKYNYMLGRMRAESAKRFLSERCGVSMYRMFEVSYGKDKPVAMSDEMNAASKNRRVTLKIWGPM